ncbi:MAG TPA: cardiolipin synthase [Xanthomonadaceae bacterium]|nr:cardiolipin synthase [Xanthomonadaceae bacterium]
MPDAVLDLFRFLRHLPDLGLWLTLGWIVYLVGIGSWIVLQKREPAATLSWLMGLALLPYVGFAVYYVFGPQRIRRQRTRRSKLLAALPGRDALAASDGEAHELAVLGQAASGMPPSTATDVQLLVDGAAKYTALLADIAKARREVHLEYYIYQPDRSGTALRDALAERARAGIKVRLLMDAVGSTKASTRFFAPLVEAGGEIAWFHPVRWLQVWQRPWLNLRTHRKIVVIDGRIAYTGGMNITDEQDERLDDKAYRDLHLRLEGDVVQTLQQVFVEDWAYATGAPPPAAGTTSEDIAAPATPAVKRIPAQVLVSGPDSPWETIHRLHVAAIHAASERVWLMTPYFVPGEAAMMALTSAALGGLDVRLLVPRRSDSLLVTLAARSYFDTLLKAGVHIHEYGPRLLHSKALLVDDDLALIGSANFDNRSFRLNFEVSMLFLDAGVATELAGLIEAESAKAPLVHEDRARPLLTVRLPEALARLLSPLL